MERDASARKRIVREGGFMNAPAVKKRLYAISAPFSGIEVWFRALSKTFASRPEWETTWDWISYEPPERIARLPLVSTRWELKAGLVARSRLLSFLHRRGGVDVLLANHMLPLAFLGSFARRTPVVLSLDATPELMAASGTWYVDRTRRPAMMSRVRKSMVTRVYRMCSLLLPWSEAVRDSLVGDYGIDPAKVVVLPPGLDLSEWAASDPAGRGNPVRLLFVGGDFRRKGGDLLLRVLADPVFDACRVDVVTREKVKAPDANVFVHHDLVAGSPELRDLYRRADLFVLPTQADFAPTNAVMEAMASGLPVITTDTGGMSRVVHDGETGFVIPIGDAVALKERLRRLVGDAGLRERMGRAGRREAERSYSLATNADRLVMLLAGVVQDAVHGRMHGA
jgi:glycosyltransferase involved in cell wall biosynthesis